jgi:DNA-binding response OmpR family regulator
MTDGGGSEARGSVLYVDDDPEMIELVTRILQVEGYKVAGAANGDEMRDYLRKCGVDLVLLDLMLPGEDGLTLARALRAESDMPVVIVSGRNDVIDKVVGLEVGADDYVTKPFHPRELTARISSVLRRYHATSGRIESGARDQVARFEGWSLELSSHRLASPDDRTVTLTGYEFRVLETFVRNPGQVLSREMILERAADRAWDPFDRSVDVVIGKLRRKLDDDPKNPRFIKTIRSGGYMLVADVAMVARSSDTGRQPAP